MKLQAKYDDIDKLGIEINNKKEEIDNILKNIEKMLDEVETAWTGTDSDTYVKGTKEIIDAEKARAEKIRLISDALRYSAAKYKNNDEEGSSTFKNEEIN